MNNVCLAGCVILYKPNLDTITNVESYIDYVKTLFIVNNGDGSNVINALLSKYNNIVVINFNENVGIARALNEVLRRCNRHYTHLLTMDQDSRFTKGSMDCYLDEIKKFDWERILGIAPKIVGFDASPYCVDIAWKNTLRVITSGNIISVKNAIGIGGFDENLFIDEVDFEFCYRGLVNKLACYECINGINLMHKIGENKKKFILYKTFSCMNHNHIRKYYIIRNRFYVYKKYHYLNEAYFFKRYIKYSLYVIMGIIFIEDNKIIKLKYAFRGLIDFCKNRMGKLCE